MRPLASLPLAAACIATPFAQQDIAQTPALVTTHHQITLAGAVQHYLVRAGTISRVYAGGHAMYIDDGPRRQLQADVAKFIQAGSSK